MKETLRGKIIKKYAGKKKKSLFAGAGNIGRVFKSLRRGKLFKARFYINENMIINAVAAVVLILLVMFIKNVFFGGPKKGAVSADDIAAMELSSNTFISIYELSDKYNIDFYEMLSLYCFEAATFPNKEANIRSKEEIEQAFIVNYKNIKKSYKSNTLKLYSEMFGTIFEEIKYFPVMGGLESSGEQPYIYGDSWGAPREYKNSRKHEGCDIMDRENIRGRIPVCSMTDGIIENMGWNELGGFCIGIKTDSGTYYYYAHFDRFAEGLYKGGKVYAGQPIGFMGDTGYGKKEGTQGNFPVHLHVGISPNTKIKKDFWVNPYLFLRFVEHKKAEY